MIAFEFEVNGNPLGIAGTDDLSVLTAIISAVGKLGSYSRGTKGLEEDYYIEFTVGGLTARRNADEDEHLDWMKENLKIGDIVTIRCVEVTSADSPKSAGLILRKAEEKKNFEWAKKFYFANRERYEGSS